MSVTGTEIAEPKSAKRKATALKQPYARSRVGNGKELLSGIDQRSLPYREYQDAVADLVHHMGNAPTATELAMIEEAAGLIVWCRSARLMLLQGGEFNIAGYCTAVNSLRRLLVDLGLEQRLLDVTPAESLEAYIARRAAEKATEAATATEEAEAT